MVLCVKCHSKLLNDFYGRNQALAHNAIVLKFSDVLGNQQEYLWVVPQLVMPLREKTQ